jgi:hypothetical protein
MMTSLPPLDKFTDELERAKYVSGILASSSLARKTLADVEASGRSLIDMCSVRPNSTFYEWNCQGFTDIEIFLVDNTYWVTGKEKASK